ncbi:hypothetical protein GPA23_09650 [Aromatoleum aromaticum]|nr:hypothetical protein [Aromatoleum aromaticum]
MKPRFALWPRLTDWALVLLVLVVLVVLVALIAPHQLPVSLYKLSLVALAGVAGYWLDRSMFPYARPDGYLCVDWRRGTLEPQYAAARDRLPDPGCGRRAREPLPTGCADPRR